MKLSLQIKLKPISKNILMQIVIITGVLLGTPKLVFAKNHNFDLLKDDYSIKSVKGKLVAVKPLCPQGRICITDGTALTLEFSLLGCMDRLGPINYKIAPSSKNKNSVDIFISALNIQNEKSENTRCLRMPTETYNLTLVDKFFEKEQIHVHFLGNTP